MTPRYKIINKVFYNYNEWLYTTEDEKDNEKIVKLNNEGWEIIQIIGKHVLCKKIIELK